MLAKSNKRKSLASNGPPSKSPKVKASITPAKPTPKQVKTPQAKPVAKGQGQKKGARQNKMPAMVAQDSDSDDDEEDVDELENEEGSSDDLEIDMGEEDEDSDDDEDDDNEQVDDEENDSDEALGTTKAIEEDSNEDEDESDDEAGDKVPKQKLEKKNKEKKENKQRYVIFVGNIPYSSTADVIRDHFKQVGPIVDVRIVTYQNKKPRGYCFVEFKDSQSYEKSLSLHHSFLSGRRINVEYTGKNKDENQKKETKKKNFKLQAMQKQGKLEGGVKATQKRAVRRAKAKQAKNEEADTN